MQLTIKDKIISCGKKPLVCVPLMGKTDKEIDEHLEKILEESQFNNIDILEFRGDFYNELEDVKKLTEVLSRVRNSIGDKILLFTIRSPKEGGEKRDYDKLSIEEINRFVIDNKLADMVDVELFSIFGEECDEDSRKEQPEIVLLARKRGVKIIMSNHNFSNTPSQEIIVNRLVSMQNLGADIVKIAVMPNTEKDLLTLLQATYYMRVNHCNTPVVTMSMGAKGALSRVAGEIFGSAITFGVVGDVSAPGQIPVKMLSDMLEKIHNHCVE